jgi:hypothetical protein
VNKQKIQEYTTEGERKDIRSRLEGGRQDIRSRTEGGRRFKKKGLKGEGI